MHGQWVSWGGLAAQQLLALKPCGSEASNHMALQMSTTDLSADNGFAMRNWAFAWVWALRYLTTDRRPVALSGGGVRRAKD